MSHPVDALFDRFLQRRDQLELSLPELRAALSRYRGVVLYGAGSSGIALLLALRKAGIAPLCFSDGAAEKWGTVCMGLPVLPPSDLVGRYGPDFLVVVCINTDGRRYCRSFSEALRAGGHSGVHQSLRACGCEHVVDSIDLRRCFALFRGDGTGNLPSCPDVEEMLAHRREIKEIYARLSDDLSRDTYRNILAFRLLDESAEIETFSQDEQYFPQNLFRLSPQEDFVDCGAYDGLTLQGVLARTGGRIGTYYALEPDRENRKKLGRFLATLPSAVGERVEVSPCAAWSDGAGTDLCALHGPGSFVAPYGGARVPTTTIDALLGGRRATAIKMNIEGSELPALAGAAETIRRHRPKLMIAGYHKTWDFWQVPARILRLGGEGYRLYLRSYMHHLSFIFYGIPPHCDIT